MIANSMNVIINNRNLLPKRDKFKNRLGGYGKNRKTEYNLPKANTKQLRAIGRRLKEEHRIRMLKVICFTIVGFLGLMLLLVYLVNDINETFWF